MIYVNPFYLILKVFRNLYLTFISIFAIIVFIVSVRPDFNTPEKRKFRGILFLILGLSSAAPIIHLAILG